MGRASKVSFARYCEASDSGLLVARSVESTSMNSASSAGLLSSATAVDGLSNFDLFKTAVALAEPLDKRFLFCVLGFSVDFARTVADTQSLKTS